MNQKRITAVLVDDNLENDLIIKYILYSFDNLSNIRFAWFYYRVTLYARQRANN